MASLVELAYAHTTLRGGALSHLQRLVASWGLLADFCFSDLLLFAGIAGDDEKLVVLSQVRPTTAQTLYRNDIVGTVVDEGDRPLLLRCWRLGEQVEGEITLDTTGERVRVQCIPVRSDRELVGVCTRESTPSLGRSPGELERTYVEIFNRFARMIASGDFPFRAEDTESEEAPRVGDGVMLLDAGACVQYASPNAVSALHRAGVHASALGIRIGQLGLDESAVRTAFAIRGPVTEEVERGPQVTLVLRCIPLIDRGEVSGGVLLIRDISDIRRRDRQLVTKDATIREIHHRVKNNLQTISSLLRLQGRRLAGSDAKEAIEETARRIRSIALVHESLSRDASEDVEVAEVVRPLVRMVEEGLASPERPVAFHVDAGSGRVAARVATPLAMVLTELLQNAVEHAFVGPAAGGGEVSVQVRADQEELRVVVADDGAGVPEGFDADGGGLGFSIVRALVTTELGGRIEVRPGGGSGDRPGTIVELTVPVVTTTTVER